MNTCQQERERIRTVYAAYDQSERVQRRWDPRNPGNQAMARERARRMELALRRAGHWPGTDDRVLEIGCGFGDVLATLAEAGIPQQNLHGVDLLPNRIAAARRRLPRAQLECRDGAALAYPDASFAIVALFTVISSVRDREASCNLAREAARVLRPGGAVLWYDLRLPNPYNREVRAMRRGELVRLFPGFRPMLSSLTVLPPLARRLGPLTPRLYAWLATLPCLRTHWLGLLVKPESSGSRESSRHA